jgi:hypothetical protein
VVKLRIDRDERSLKRGLVRTFRGVGGGHFAPVAKHVRHGFVRQGWPIGKWDPTELPLRDNLDEAIEDLWGHVETYLAGGQ